MANMGQGTSIEMEPVEQQRRQEEAPEKKTDQEASTEPEREREWEKEIEAVKDELVARAGLKEKEKQLPKTIEEEKKKKEIGEGGKTRWFHGFAEQFALFWFLESIYVHKNMGPQIC